MADNRYYRQTRQTREMREEDIFSLVTVTGVGQVEAEPDVAVLQFGVVTNNKDAQKAQEENSKVMNQVLDGLEADGIPEENIKTIQYTVYPQYDYVDGKQIFRDYEVRYVIEVKVEDIDNLGTILENAIKNGVNYQQNLAFTVSDVGQYYDKALQLAVKNGDIKAQEIANNYGKNIELPPVKVIEKTSMNQATANQAVYAKSSGNVPIQSGLVVIVAVVESQYKY